MIHPLKEEGYVAVYLIMYGIYIVSTYDIFVYCSNNSIKKKFIKIIFEIIFCIFQLIITYLFSYKLASGYIPIYFILFFVIGCFIYFLFLKKRLRSIIDTLLQIISKHKQKIKKMVLALFYSETLIRIIIKPFKKLVHFRQKKKKSVVDRN